MTVFYIFAILAFLSISLLFILSLFLFDRMNTCLNTAEEAKSFHQQALDEMKSLKDLVSTYRKNAQSTKYHQEELEKTFNNLKETAIELQSAYKARKAALDLMRR